MRLGSIAAPAPLLSSPIQRGFMWRFSHATGSEVSPGLTSCPPIATATGDASLSGSETTNSWMRLACLVGRSAASQSPTGCLLFRFRGTVFRFRGTATAHGLHRRDQRRSDSFTGPLLASTLRRMLDGTRNTRPGDAGHGKVLPPMTFLLWVATTVGKCTSALVHSNKR